MRCDLRVYISNRDSEEPVVEDVSDTITRGSTVFDDQYKHENRKVHPGPITWVGVYE